MRVDAPVVPGKQRRSFAPGFLRNRPQAENLASENQSILSELLTDECKLGDSTAAVPAAVRRGARPPRSGPRRSRDNRQDAGRYPMIPPAPIFPFSHGPLLL